MSAAVPAAAVLCGMAFAASRSETPLRQILASALCGAGALGAVNLLAPVTGVEIAVNHASSFMAAVLGAPGVITLLLLRILMA